MGPARPASAPFAPTQTRPDAVIRPDWRSVCRQPPWPVVQASQHSQSSAHQAFPSPPTFLLDKRSLNEFNKAKASEQRQGEKAWQRGSTELPFATRSMTTLESTHTKFVDVAQQKPVKLVDSPTLYYWDGGALPNPTSKDTFQGFGIDGRRKAFPQIFHHYPNKGKEYVRPIHSSKDARGAALPHSHSSDAFQAFISMYKPKSRRGECRPTIKNAPPYSGGTEEGAHAEWTADMPNPTTKDSFCLMGVPPDLATRNATREVTKDAVAGQPWRKAFHGANPPPFSSKTSDGKIIRSTSTDTFVSYDNYRASRRESFRPMGE